MANPPDCETTRPLPTLDGGLAPIRANAPSADRILCRGRAASGSRRHEGPSWMVVSRRSGKQRPPRGAARLQARVGSGSASPPPGRTDSPASTLSVAPVWPGGPGGCWPTRRCCQVGRSPVGAIGPNFGGTLGRCCTVLRSDTKQRPMVYPRLVVLVALGTYRLRRCCTALSGSRGTRPHDCQLAHHLRGVHAGDGRLTQVSLRLPSSRPPRDLRP
jgi:hypothetical protein